MNHHIVLCFWLSSALCFDIAQLGMQRADGGNPAWSPPPTPTPPTAAAVGGAAGGSNQGDGSATKVLILGASGMLGPDVVRCLSGDLETHGGDETAEYSIRITDVLDRPTR